MKHNDFVEIEKQVVICTLDYNSVAAVTVEILYF